MKKFKSEDPVASGKGQLKYNKQVNILLFTTSLVRIIKTGFRKLIRCHFQFQTQPLMGLVSAGCSSDIVRSGHLEYNSLWASNDVHVSLLFMIPIDNVIFLPKLRNEIDI